MGNAGRVGRIGKLTIAPEIGIKAAKRMTTSIFATAMVATATVQAVPVPTLSPAVGLAADSTALILGGTSVPTPDSAYVAVVRGHFIAPTHPGQDIDYVPVTTPEEFWPITGLVRSLGLLAGPPSVWGPDGPAWPDEPWWKLSGLFDLTIDQSIQAGTTDLQAAMAEHGNNHLVIYGYSQGAVIANQEKRKLAAQYPAGTTAPDIDFVLSGDLNVPNGGLHARFPGLYIPILDWSFNGAEPTNTQFDTTVITRQYDGLADFPLYPLNVIADLNAVLGVIYVHTADLDVTLPPDPSTSPAYQGTHGDTSYYFFQTQNLPLLDPLRALGVPEALIAVVQPFFRVLVELGYDRSIPPWEPTPARLVPPLHPAKVITDLVRAIGQGIANALVNSPASLSSHTSARFAALRSGRVAPKTANAGRFADVSLSETAAEFATPPSTAPVAADFYASKEPLTKQNSATPRTAAARADSFVFPKLKPSATTLAPKTAKHAARPATQTPAGWPTHDLAMRHSGRPDHCGQQLAGRCRFLTAPDHRLGPGDVSFEAQRFRLGAVALHQVPVPNIVATGPPQ